MSKYELLKPYYCLSLSGGKDSLYMLYYVLNNLDKYPLNCVVYFDLDIDYPFIKDVIKNVQLTLNQLGIKFLSFKPTHNWEFYYSLYGYPARNYRWCNSKYKLDCKRQCEEYFFNIGFRVIWYIGYCFDEIDRYSKRKSSNEIYPLVCAKIYERDILEWAKNQSIYNNYYKINARCGCMGCPMSSFINWAYLYVFYYEHYCYFISKMRASEIDYFNKYGKSISFYQSTPKYNADYLERIVITKYVPYVRSLLNFEQISFWSEL